MKTKGKQVELKKVNDSEVIDISQWVCDVIVAIIKHSQKVSYVAKVWLNVEVKAAFQSFLTDISESQYSWVKEGCFLLIGKILSKGFPFE